MKEAPCQQRRGSVPNEGTHLRMLYDPNMKPMVKPTPVPIMAPILVYSIDVMASTYMSKRIEEGRKQRFALTSLESDVGERE